MPTCIWRPSFRKAFRCEELIVVGDAERLDRHIARHRL
jgi:hypothetical protein